ncbi:MAG: HAMP domain-containing histidine kinase, partial [Clostridia bacterium]|nr:HAMP domain-containing histidine kinase [Clostridia bacterium]
IISQKMINPVISIRTRMVAALLAVTGIAFYLVSVLMVDLIGSTLLRNMTMSQMETLNTLAVSLGEKSNVVSADEFYRQVIEAARRNGGRLLVSDLDGKITVDSYDQWNGERVTEAEVYSVIASGSQAYGFYPEMENDRTIWRGHFASALLDSNGKKVGVLVRIASIQSLVDALRTMRTRMTLIFAAALLVVALAIVMITRLMTRPIHELSEGIRSMGEGDFTRRVRVKGRDELAQLAAAFNKMEDQVQSLDETRNQFVSNASHELKTPLATMKILLESILYSDNMDRATQNEFLSDINKEIDRLTSVVSDLLTLAHIDSKKLTLKREELYLSDVVRESVERLMPMAANRKQTINVSIEDECEMVADESKLEQVCYNLIGNAVKYTGNDGKIDVRLFRNGRDAVMTVSDNGIGIPEEDLPHIFDRFYRVDKARTRTEGEGGTGLGLSIVKQIVRLHAGTVTVASKVGEGTVFTVTLPLMSSTEGGAH